MSHATTQETAAMRRAIELARRGEGYVEPNPMVGAVIVDHAGRQIAEGWHERCGGPHAEVHALRSAGSRAAGSTLVVSLEPCCHVGRTPPCTPLIAQAGIARVVVGTADPSAHAAGKGLAELRAAGIDVEVGLLADETGRLIAPFAKRVTTALPWVHAKWAMTLDGKIATRSGASQWISGEASRAKVHELRGRMDAIVIGAGTVRADDPRLMARPPGPRLATRIVLDSQAALSLDSQLVRSAGEAPLLVAAGESLPTEHVERLRSAGVEVLALPASENGRLDLLSLLRELGRREMSNILVEGGGGVLGSFFDDRLFDEVHVFIAPKLAGGAAAPSPILGDGLSDVTGLPQLDDPTTELLDGDIYIRGRIARR